MNRPVRRVALAVMVMIVVLLGNITYVQVVMAGQYRDDSRNQRSQIDEYSRQRGQIVAGGQVLAQSVEMEDEGLAAWAIAREESLETAFQTLMTGLGIRYFKAVAGSGS